MDLEPLKIYFSATNQANKMCVFLPVLAPFLCFVGEGSLCLEETIPEA